jgi:hypothetical protein
MSADGIVCRSPDEYDSKGIAEYLPYLRQSYSGRACSGRMIHTKAATA